MDDVARRDKRRARSPASMELPPANMSPTTLIHSSTKFFWRTKTHIDLKLFHNSCADFLTVVAFHPKKHQERTLRLRYSAVASAYSSSDDALKAAGVPEKDRSPGRARRVSGNSLALWLVGRLAFSVIDTDTEGVSTQNAVVAAHDAAIAEAQARFDEDRSHAKVATEGPTPPPAGATAQASANLASLSTSVCLTGDVTTGAAQWCAEHAKITDVEALPAAAPELTLTQHAIAKTSPASLPRTLAPLPGEAIAPTVCMLRGPDDDTRLVSRRGALSLRAGGGALAPPVISSDGCAADAGTGGTDGTMDCDSSTKAVHQDSNMRRCALSGSMHEANTMALAGLSGGVETSGTHPSVPLSPHALAPRRSGVLKSLNPFALSSKLAPIAAQGRDACQTLLPALIPDYADDAQPPPPMPTPMSVRAPTMMSTTAAARANNAGAVEPIAPPDAAAAARGRQGWSITLVPQALDTFNVRALLAPPSPPPRARPSPKPLRRAAPPSKAQVGATKGQLPRRPPPPPEDKTRRWRRAKLPAMSPTNCPAPPLLPPTPARRKLLLDLDASRDALCSAVSEAKQASDRCGQTVEGAVGWRAVRRALHEHRFRAPKSPKRSIEFSPVPCSTPCSTPTSRAATTLPALPCC